jgi:hypothetical protein
MLDRELAVKTFKITICNLYKSLVMSMPKN